MKFNLFGTLFMLYGILKVLLVMSITWFIPPNIQKQLSTIEGLDLFISGDTTLAGRMIDYILLSFGLFTTVHGMVLNDILKAPYIETKPFQYFIYTGLGLFSILFYTLTIYTNLPINKDPKEYENYKIYGYIGGISFLAVPVLWELSEYLFPMLNKLSVEKQMMYMTLIMFIGLGALAGMFYSINRLKKAQPFNTNSS